MAVASIEEEMELQRKLVAEKVKYFKDDFSGKINDIQNAEPEDFSSIVQDKLDKGGGVSYSSLKRFRESPLSYIHHLKTPFVRTPAMLLGSVVDDLITNKDKFWKNWFIIPEKPNLRSNAGKATMALYREIAGKAEVIDANSTLIKWLRNKAGFHLFIKSLV